MACGVPCVVTEAGDAPEIVGDTGRIVPVGDMSGLAREVLALLDETPQARQALGEKARQRVQANFDIGRVTEQYQSFYDSLMDATKPCAA